MRTLRELWNTQSKGQGFRLNVANRLWGQEGYRFLPDFLRTTRVDYGAEFGPLDFRSDPEQARQAINRWVEDNTAHKITNLIPSAAAFQNARLVLTNAVYFKGEWQVPFSPTLTRDQDFHISPDQQTKAPLMQKQAVFGYAAFEGLQLLQLPYGDRSLSMIVLLPEALDGLSSLEDKLNSADLDKWRQTTSRVARQLLVYLPKFEDNDSVGVGHDAGSDGHALGL